MAGPREPTSGPDKRVERSTCPASPTARGAYYGPSSMGAAENAGATGRELLEAIRDGRLPPAPIQRILDFDLVEVDDGRVAFRYRPSGEHCNPMGSVHGGVAMTLLDSAAGASLHSTLGLGEAYTTLETKVNLVRTIRPDGAALRA